MKESKIKDLIMDKEKETKIIKGKENGKERGDREMTEIMRNKKE